MNSAFSGDFSIDLKIPNTGITGCLKVLDIIQYFSFIVSTAID
jgi:hypothetical protein